MDLLEPTDCWLRIYAGPSPHRHAEIQKRSKDILSLLWILYSRRISSQVKYWGYATARVAIIRTPIFSSSPPPYAGSGEVWLRYDVGRRSLSEAASLLSKRRNYSRKILRKVLINALKIKF